MGSDTSFGSENFNPALIYRGEGKHELSSVKDISSGNMVHPYEKERLEFEKTTGIYRKNWSDGIGIAQSPSKIWERSFSAWLIYVKINELKTMLISNAEKEDLIEVIGLASFDRIIQDGSAINLDGENFRRIRNTKKVDDSILGME